MLASGLLVTLGRARQASAEGALEANSFSFWWAWDPFFFDNVYIPPERAPGSEFKQIAGFNVDAWQLVHALQCRYAYEAAKSMFSHASSSADLLSISGNAVEIR